jgi:uncharacterized delta-60 repeat protein
LEQRRFLSAGGLDPSFSGDGQAVVSFPGSDFVVNDVAVQPNGQVVVAGEKGLTGAVARLNADGTVDASFGSGGLSEIFRLGQANGVALQPDGRILVAGTVDDHFAVVRLLPGGSLDESFANHGVMRKSLGEWSSAYDLAIQPDGNIIAVGYRYAGLVGDDDFEILRINPAGGLDESFDLDGVATVGFGGDEEARAVAIDTRGGPATNPLYGSIVVVGGEFSSFRDSHSKFSVARLTPTGALDPAFDGDGKLSMSFPGVQMACATGVLIQSGGKIVVTGTVGPDSFYYGGGNDFALARFLPNGGLDSSFGAAGTGRVITDFGGNDRAFAAIANHLGGITLGGVSGSSFALAAYTADGRADNRFGGDGTVTTPGGPTVSPGNVLGLAAAPGRRLVIAGQVGRANRYFDVAPVVGVLSFDTIANEQGQQTAAFLVGLDQASPDPLRVYLSVGGTATPPSRATRNPDYTYTGMALEDPLDSRRAYVDIPAGQTFATVVMTPADDALGEGDETAVFAIRPAEEYDAGPDSAVTLTIRDNDAVVPARVARVFVNGQNLMNNAAFRTAAGMDATFGYSIPDGEHQLRSFPWFNGINKVSLRFDRDVASSLDQADLVVRGSAGPIATTAFAYDAAARTGTWTLGSAVTLDKLRLVLSAAGVTGLDGEWVNPSTTTPAGDTYPSGNGATGGDFNFRINVLRGDSNGDSVVNALDVADVKKRLSRRPGDGVTGGNAYSIFADLNADGVINALDVAAVKARLGTRLSMPDPATVLLLR